MLTGQYNTTNPTAQSPKHLVIHAEMMSNARIVALSDRHQPAAIAPLFGDSIGRWEGDTLVVDTVGFLPGVLNAPVRHSDQLHVVERFTLDPATMQLRRTYEAKDPVYLKGTYAGQDVIQPADVPWARDECKEQQFINYSKQGQR
jgi:hypothetical protein